MTEEHGDAKADQHKVQREAGTGKDWGSRQILSVENNKGKNEKESGYAQCGKEGSRLHDHSLPRESDKEDATHADAESAGSAENEVGGKIVEKKKEK